MPKKKQPKSPKWSGRKLRQFREARGWSLNRLSSEVFAATRLRPNGPGVEIPYQSLVKYEEGREPGATATIGLCKALNKNPEDFLE